MNYPQTDLVCRVDRIVEHIIDLRRQFHRFPELSEQESATSRRIQAELDALQIPYRKEVAGHGIIAVIPGRDKAHSVGVRADMDALPLTEHVDTPFKSQCPGVMHACGHDIHTAIMLGTAHVLQEIRDDLPGSVSLFFQPAEETIGGARQMIEAGCLKNPLVTSTIGLHVDPDVNTGDIQLIPGAMNAASCEFSVTVTGRSCHGAYPTAGVDALLPACAMVSSLQSIITRNVDPTEAALITVGTFHSGTKENIISGEAKFAGIIRVLNMDQQTHIKGRIQELCTSIASAYGAACRVEFFDSYPSLRNDDQLFTWVKASSEEVLGADHVLVSPQASLGADDFSYFCHSGRGLYYNLGTRKPGDTDPAPLHSDRFDPDEGCIRVGILTQAAAVLKILEEESKTW